MFKSEEGKTYKNKQVKITCRHIVKILLTDVLDTRLTPVKYPT